MKYSKYAVPGLLWTTGVAAALALAGCGGGSGSDDDDNGGATKPSTYILDSVVLPASAIKSAAVAPASLGASVQTRFVVLPELEAEKTVASDNGPAQQIGTQRAVAATSTVAQTQSALQWSSLANGQQVAAINIQSTGAYGLRAGVLVDSLPDGAQLRVYSQEHPNAIVERSGAEVNALLAQNRKAGETGAAANTWWTPDVGAGDTTVEVVLPAGTDADALRISIPVVSHIYVNLSLPTDAELAEAAKADAAKVVDTSGACNLDASCTNNYQTERNAVARMSFTRSDGKSYLCTGTLLNNTKGDFAPYFITGNHCISTQSSASSMQTAWFYRSSSCNSSVPGANAALRNAGATLLYATASTDSALLKLNEMPPVGVTLAGWDARTAGQVGDAVYGLHHPDGNLLKYSVGSVVGFMNCTAGSGTSITCSTGDSNSSFYSVRWSQGTTEGGSSGSALFRDGRVIGNLYGGGASCQAPNASDFYGRFDKVFSDRIWNWLAS
ncbi:trypsin-like peptidase domain-containing protein [Comamonas sp. JUb58]|uniref:trypsin-like serine peptidase n=1 Tax=Comamonas sp. JUb58 TaxID=2485114 RepID=UPI00105F06AB|nr:trypsin-like peptidase domain-containing protein [Comamonas sp. JUb58]TDS84426.1 trypsin-like peptidase [Comamonas sp. JUb58]